jgi:hypothetical protein
MKQIDNRSGRLTVKVWISSVGVPKKMSEDFLHEEPPHFVVDPSYGVKIVYEDVRERD